MDNRRRSGLLFKLLCFFDCHITEFIGVKDFAALLALDVLGVLFAGYYAHSGVFARGVHCWFLAVNSDSIGKIVSGPYFLSI